MQPGKVGKSTEEKDLGGTTGFHGDTVPQSVNPDVAGVNTAVATMPQNDDDTETGVETTSWKRTANVLPDQRGQPSEIDEVERLGREIAELKKQKLQKDKDILQDLKKDMALAAKREEQATKREEQATKREEHLRSEVDELKLMVKKLEEDKENALKEVEKLKKDRITYEEAFTTIPLPQAEFFFQESVSVGAPKTFPETILPWTTCVVDATQAFAKLNVPEDVMKSFLPFDRTIVWRDVECETEVSSIIDPIIHTSASTFFRRLNEQNPFFTQMEHPIWDREKGISYKVDFFMYKKDVSNGRLGFFVGEVKRFAMFMGSFKVDGEKLYSIEGLIRYMSSKPGPAAAVDQLTNYMSLRKLKYGKLDTYHGAIYVKIEDEKLYMSQLFSYNRTNPTRLKIEVGVLAMAMNDGFDFGGLILGPFVKSTSDKKKTQGEKSSEEKRRSNKSHEKNTPSPGNDVGGTSNAPQGSTLVLCTNGHKKIFDVLTEKGVPKSRLKIIVRDSGLLVQGLYADTFLCEVDGIGDAICKVIRDPLGKEEMEIELKMYRGPLLQLQGTYIPELIGEQVNAENETKAMVLSYIKGTPLNEVKEHRKYRKLAMEALEQVHECGVLHGDIGLRNFILTSEKDRVFIIDFGRSSQVEEHEASKDAFHGEMRQLYMEF